MEKIWRYNEYKLKIYVEKLKEKEKVREKRRMEESRVETIYIIRPNHLNGAGRLFGGTLVQWIDEVAGIVAMRHTRENCITASIDNLKFIRGAYLGEHVVLIGRLTYVGNTSMEVRVDTYVEDRQGMRRPINRAYLTMVALDENDHPIQVPELIIETEEQRGEWEAAKKRREMRERRSKEGF